MKKVVRIVILSVFAFCLSIACKNYTEDIEDYLSYWSAGVSIAEYRFEPQPQIYTEGMQYVPSKAPVTVTFTVHNSKNLNLKMPGDSDAPADIISFPHIPDAPDKRAAAPQSGNDYEFKKISNTELTLTYNPAFLQKYEWGRGDITPSIILYTTDGRVFKQNIPFKLNVNTPPPAIAECVVGQTTTHLPSETSYYVLCLQLSDDDMKKTCGNGLLHGDIAGIEINGTIYNLSVDRKLKQLKAQPGSPFIGKDKVTKLATTDAKDIPSDWTLYFKTDVAAKPTSPKTEYTVKLKDAKGLYSEPVTVGTQGKIVTVTFNLAGGKINGSTNAITMTGLRGTPFTKPVDPIKEGYTFNDWNPPLPTHPVFPAADTTYTAQWTLNTYTVKFEVDGGHGSLTGTHDGTTHTANGSTQLQFESVPHNSMITFTATPDSGYEVDSWAGAQQDTSDNKKASLTVQDNVTVIVKFKAVGGQSPAVQVNSWEALRTAVQSATDGTVIEVTQNITYGFTSVNSIIEVNKNITIKSKGINKYTLDANGRGADSEQSNDKSTGIFEVKGGKTLTLENVILTKTEKYAVYVAEGDNSLTMKKVTITDCKTKDNAAGIYFNKGKTLTLENCTIEKCNGNGGWSSGGIDIEKPTETVSIKDTTIKNCKAPGSDTTGGGIHLWNGECTLENVTVDNCSAKKGGGMCVKKSTLTITGGSFTKNAADGKTSKGGGGAIYSEDSTVTITGCTIGGDNVGDGNSAGQGGVSLSVKMLDVL
nr:right-handed parallel beta-helix repeat-containing protein [uncultured Treponema sp.]